MKYLPEVVAGAAAAWLVMLWLLQGLRGFFGAVRTYNSLEPIETSAATRVRKKRFEADELKQLADELDRRHKGPMPNWVQITVALAILAASLWIILSGNYKDGTEKWAFGAIGLIIGHVFPKH